MSVKCKPYKRPDPKRGEVYRHFNGKVYMVLDTAEDVENDYMSVIYHLYDKPSTPIYIRSLTGFMDVLSNGVYRFEKIQ